MNFYNTFVDSSDSMLAQFSWNYHPRLTCNILPEFINCTDIKVRFFEGLWIHEITSLWTCKTYAVYENWPPRNVMIPQYVCSPPYVCGITWPIRRIIYYVIAKFLRKNVIKNKTLVLRWYQTQCNFKVNEEISITILKCHFCVSFEHWIIILKIVKVLLGEDKYTYW